MNEKHTCEESTTERPLGERLRSVRADTRGVSGVIGATIMFGVVIAVLVLVQTAAVPTWVAETEVDHHQQVRADIQAVSATISRVAATGQGELTTVDTGLRYSSHLFFQTPPPTAGTLSATNDTTIELRNAVTAGDAGDYWDGRSKRYHTSSITYTPAYAQYRTAPNVSSVLGTTYTDNKNSSTLTAGDGFIQGRQISLLLVDGEVSKASAGTTTLSVDPVSAPTHETMLTGKNGEPIVIVVRTSVGRQVWAELLQPQVENEGYVRGYNYSTKPGLNRLEVTLQPDVTYSLSIAKVTLADTHDSPAPAYVEGGTTDATVAENDTQTFGVRLFDSYGNPVAGGSVAVRTTHPDSSASVRSPPGSGGRVTIVYEYAGTVSQRRQDQIQVTVDPDGFTDGYDPSEPESAQISVTVNPS